MMITAIETQRRRADRFNIFVDGEFGFALSGLDLSTAGLRVGQELNADQLAEWRLRSEEGRAYGAALRFLSYRPRSRREVEEYLGRKEYGREVTEAVVERLTAAGLVDDLAFAAAWVANRVALRPRSRRMLEQELRQKGVGAADIQAALDGLPEDEYLETIRRVAAKKQRSAQYQDPEKLRQYLLHQGFGWAEIKRALDGSSEYSA